MGGVITMRIRWRMISTLVVVFLLVPLPELRSEEPSVQRHKEPVTTYSHEERIKRFELFTRCEPIRLLVEPLEEAERKVGLTFESLVAAAESRLRSARLYDKNAEPFIYLNVHVVGSAFSVSLEFHKYLYDAYSDQVSFAPTWNIVINGTHGGSRSSGIILSQIAKNMDQFLLEYLRVNEEQCS